MSERLNMDGGWRFALGHAANDSLDFGYADDQSFRKAGGGGGPAAPDFDDSAWRAVSLPHDWAVEQPFDPRGGQSLCYHGFRAVGPEHPESSVGWYRRVFELPRSDARRRVWVEFDGVFRDSQTWINGHLLGRHQSGYTSFRYDLSDYLEYDGRNVLVVRVDASRYEGWFYEGAGIYRHVWLVKAEPLHVAPWGVFVIAEPGRTSAKVSIQTRVLNESDAATEFVLEGIVTDPKGKAVARIKPAKAKLDGWSEITLEQRVHISNPRLWSCEEPNLYRLRTVVRSGNRPLDRCETVFGIRSLRWDPRNGFFLNGKHVKIKGVCCHQDHAGVGSALPDRLQYYRIERLKEMGCNAYRTSHNPPTPELLDACDQLGILVMDETRLAGSSPEWLGQLESMVLRDRNHPCVILWSIGNEETRVQGTPVGARIGASMKRLIRRLDPTRAVTAAMNNGGAGDGFVKVEDVHGWNYLTTGKMDEWHAAHPHMPIVGSEEASTLSTRGIYAKDPNRGYVSAYDDNVPCWGSTAEGWWSFYATRPWLAGGFAWTGFDYRGEPTPYNWPCINSHFGILDTCGFPKDNAFYYKAWWTDKPVLHILPHWNWPGREGQAIDVRCFTNCRRVALFLNGRALGERTVARYSHARWEVPYEPGILEAHGFNGANSVISARVETSGEPAALRLGPDRSTMLADGQDVICVAVSALDAKGRLVPTADCLVRFDVHGPGRLIGVGNGDPSSHESDKAPMRKLFNGLAMAIVQADSKPGLIRFTARADGLKECSVSLRTTPCKPRPSVP